MTLNGEPLTGSWKRNGVKEWFSADNGTPYGRMSGLADILDDKSGLIDWAVCAAMIGLARDPALYAGVSAIASQHRDPWNTKEAKFPLKEFGNRAKTAGGTDAASDLGTAFHTFTEIQDFGKRPEFLPGQFIPLLDEYARATKMIEMVTAELFVVTDELKRAGSFDRLVRMPDNSVFEVPWLKEPVDLSGRTLIADIKSGKHDANYPLKPTVQIAGYAHGILYDQKSGDRQVIDPDLTKDFGLLIHYPIRTAGSKCSLYLLDLMKGWRLAQLAEEVREETKMPKLKELEWV